MRIVSLDELKKMPDGTLYAEYTPAVLLSSPLLIVGHYDDKPDGGWNGSISLLSVDDKFIENMDFDVWDDCHADYTDDDRFAVFEPNEIDIMIKILQFAKGDIPYNELDKSIDDYNDSKI